MKNSIDSLSVGVVGILWLSISDLSCTILNSKLCLVPAISISSRYSPSANRHLPLLNAYGLASMFLFFRYFVYASTLAESIGKLEFKKFNPSNWIICLVQLDL